MFTETGKQADFKKIEFNLKISVLFEAVKANEL